jgi:hypothetical protein
MNKIQIVLFASLIDFGYAPKVAQSMSDLLVKAISQNEIASSQGLKINIVRTIDALNRLKDAIDRRSQTMKP